MVALARRCHVGLLGAALLLLVAPAALGLAPSAPPVIEFRLTDVADGVLSATMGFEGEDAKQVRQILDFYGNRDLSVEASEVAGAEKHLRSAFAGWAEGVWLDLSPPETVDGLTLLLANATGPVTSEEPLAARFATNLTWGPALLAPKAHLLNLSVPKEARGARIAIHLPAPFVVDSVQGHSDFALLDGGGGVEVVAFGGKDVVVHFKPGTRLVPVGGATPLPVLLPAVALLAAVLLRRRD